jgi:hypothetical protein
VVRCPYLVRPPSETTDLANCVYPVPGTNTVRDIRYTGVPTRVYECAASAWVQRVPGRGRPVVFWPGTYLPGLSLWALHLLFLSHRAAPPGPKLLDVLRLDKTKVMHMYTAWVCTLNGLLPERPRRHRAVGVEDKDPLARNRPSPENRRTWVCSECTRPDCTVRMPHATHCRPSFTTQPNFSTAQAPSRISCRCSVPRSPATGYLPPTYTTYSISSKPRHS